MVYIFHYYYYKKLVYKNGAINLVHIYLLLIKNLCTRKEMALAGLIRYNYLNTLLSQLFLDAFQVDGSYDINLLSYT